MEELHRKDRLLAVRDGLIHAGLIAWALATSTLLINQALGQSIYTPYTFRTLAGNAGYGSVDGTGRVARFYHPSGGAVDREGNFYVADIENHTIRRVTAAGVVTTLAGLAGSSGNADGTGPTARFNCPVGVAVDSKGIVYVADTCNGAIRKVTPAGVVTTLAGNGGGAPGNGPPFITPEQVAVDVVGNVYVTDSNDQTIRKVTPEGAVSTIAGLSGSWGSDDGTGSDARFYFPGGIAVDFAGNIFVADAFNHTIRKVTADGVVTTLAGLARIPGTNDGTGNTARFNGPSSVALDPAGNLYVSDYDNCTIRKIAPTGEVTTLAGSAGSAGNADGVGGDARFNSPHGTGVDSVGNIYVADLANNTIRKVTPAGLVTTLAGLAGGPGGQDGESDDGRFNNPACVAVDTATNVYVADSSNHTIRKVTPAGMVTTLVGLAGTPGTNNGTGSAARFSSPGGVTVDSAGNLYVTDTGNHTIRKVTPAGVVSTLAGLAGVPGLNDGTGTSARFRSPSGVTVDSAGNLYVADTGNHMIRKVTPAGVVTPLAGLMNTPGTNNGTGNAARFRSPGGVTVDSAGNLYVADTGNQSIRKVTQEGLVTTLAGWPDYRRSVDGIGSVARFYQPHSVAVDAAGNVFVADTGNGTIRKVTPTGVVTTLAGLADRSGSTDGTGSTARFNHPFGVASDGVGNVYVADFGNHTIRKGVPALVILSSDPGFGFHGGLFGFGLAGPADQSAVVEASIDLVNWLPLWTNTLTGNLSFSDSQSGAISNRFYRTRVP